MSTSTPLGEHIAIDRAASPPVPRAAVIVEAWEKLGRGVAPLSNATGRPLARTVKLILDPLLIRPVQNPAFSGSFIDAEAARELRDRILDARETLVATAEWYLALKSARRRAGVVSGNPQDLYFQRCFELARTHGHPGRELPEDRVPELAHAVVAEVQQAGDDALLARIRGVLADPDSARRLRQRLDDVWNRQHSAATATTPAEEPEASDDLALRTLLDACVSSAPEAPLLAATQFDSLASAGTGSDTATALHHHGTARALGLSRYEIPVLPDLGDSASKRDLPRPFDRTIFERLFAVLSTGAAHDVDGDAEEVLDREIDRAASAWQLAAEESRLAMALGIELSRALLPGTTREAGAAHRMLRARWEREAYVRRALRLPAEASGVPAALRDDIRDIRQGYIRRLWARLHGRELRAQSSTAENLWDTLDGVLRSVVMDQRQRLKRALGREGQGAA